MGQPDQIIADVVKSLCGSLDMGTHVREAFLQDLDGFLRDLETTQQLTISAVQVEAISEFLVPLLTQRVVIGTLDTLVRRLAEGNGERRSFSKSFVASLGDEAAYSVTFRYLQPATIDQMWRRHPGLVRTSVTHMLGFATGNVERWGNMKERTKCWREFVPARYLASQPEIFKQIWEALRQHVAQTKDTRALMMAGSLWEYFYHEWRKGSKTLKVCIPLYRFFPHVCRPFCQVIEVAEATLQPQQATNYADLIKEFSRLLQPELEEANENLQCVWFFLVMQRKLQNWCAMNLQESEANTGFFVWCHFPDDHLEHTPLAAALTSFNSTLREIRTPLSSEGVATLAPFLGPSSRYRFAFFQVVVPLLLNPMLVWQCVTTPNPPDIVSLCLYLEGTQLHYEAMNKQPQHLGTLLIYLTELLQSPASPPLQQ